MIIRISETGSWLIQTKKIDRFIQLEFTVSLLSFNLQSYLQYRSVKTRHSVVVSTIVIRCVSF